MGLIISKQNKYKIITNKELELLSKEELIKRKRK